MAEPERRGAGTFPSGCPIARPPTLAHGARVLIHGIAFTGLLAGFAARHEGWIDGGMALGVMFVALVVLATMTGVALSAREALRSLTFVLGAVAFAVAVEWLVDPPRQVGWDFTFEQRPEASIVLLCFGIPALLPAQWLVARGLPAALALVAAAALAAGWWTGFEDPGARMVLSAMGAGASAAALVLLATCRAMAAHAACATPAEVR